MNKIISVGANIILLLQPLFAIPLYFTVLANNPPLWVSLIISLVPLVVRYQQENTLFKRTIFDVPILIFMVGSVVGFFIAGNKDVAQTGLISLLASILIYYGVTSNGDRGKKYWTVFGTAIILISVVFAIWFFSQGPSKIFFFNRWAFDLFKSVPKTAGISLGIHGIGALFAAVIPVVIAAVLFVKTSKARILLGTLTLFLISLLFFSASGEGWMAFGVSLFVILICWDKRSLLFLIPTYSILIGVFLFFYTNTIWLNISFSFTRVTERIDLWMKTFPLLSNSHSFLGLGLGNWAEEFNKYYRSAEMTSHNNYLQIYTDIGILGVLAISFAVVIFIMTAVKMLNSNKTGILKGLSIGLVGSFIGGAFFNMFDVTLNGPIINNGSYIYLYVPFLWVWAAAYAVVFQKIDTKNNPDFIQLFRTQKAVDFLATENQRGIDTNVGKSSAE